MPPSSPDIWAAFAWGAVSSTALLVGAITGFFSRLSRHAIAMAMSVGAGLLLAAVSLKLTADAVRMAGPFPAVGSLLLGAAVFSGVTATLARFGAAHRKRCGECTPQQSESLQPGSGVGIALGTALDAVPEALVLGLALRQPAFPIELVIALSVGNLPEAMSGAAGMRTAGGSYRYILSLWSLVAIGAEGSNRLRNALVSLDTRSRPSWRHTGACARTMTQSAASASSGSPTVSLGHPSWHLPSM